MIDIWQRAKGKLHNLFRSDRMVEYNTERVDKRLLIVGLGNPGKKYAKNRHNLGFMVADHLAEAHNISLDRVETKSLIGKGQIHEYPVIIAKPQTYMNRSGFAVGNLAKYYKIDLENILVVYDELDLPFGSMRLRRKGGAGGHNGMKSIIQVLGQDFPRMRIGIGRPPGKMDPAAYVLKDFYKDELATVGETLDLAVSAIRSFVLDGIDLAMTRFNQ